MSYEKAINCNMKLLALSLVIFFTFLPKYTQQTFWRTPKPTLPSNPNAKFYKELQEIPSPQKTAKKVLKNFFHYRPHNVRLAKRNPINEDIVVIVDGSGSVTKCEFNRGTDALAQMIGVCEELPMYSCRHAGVTFSHSAKTNFKFLPPKQAKQQMKAIAYPGGWTNTQAGLAEAYKLFQKKGINGSRPGSKRRVLLLTDGRSNIKENLTIPNANKLKNNAVEIFVVAVGNYIRGIDEMAKVASYPPTRHVFRVEKNTDLLYVFKLALKEVSGKYKVVKQPSPC